MNYHEGLSENQKRTIKLQETKYFLIKGDFYWKNKDDISHLFLEKGQASIYFKEMDEGVC